MTPYRTGTLTTTPRLSSLRLCLPVVDPRPSGLVGLEARGLCRHADHFPGRLTGVQKDVSSVSICVQSTTPSVGSTVVG